MKKMLIVDDSPHIRLMLRVALRKHFELDEAVDADEASARLHKSPPDGILLDVMLPGSINGFQLCERIKRDESLSRIHVVLITARSQVSDQELGRSLGADAYFLKPFSPAALTSHLLRAFGSPS